MDMYRDRMHTANKLRTPFNRKPAQYMAAAMALAAYNEGDVEATIKKTSRFVLTNPVTLDLKTTRYIQTIALCNP